MISIADPNECILLRKGLDVQKKKKKNKSCRVVSTVGAIAETSAFICKSAEVEG